jgi:hypothetical protein
VYNVSLFVLSGVWCWVIKARMKEGIKGAEIEMRGMDMECIECGD